MGSKDRNKRGQSTVLESREHISDTLAQPHTKNYAWTLGRYLELVDVLLWRIQQHDGFKATPIKTQLYTPRSIPVVLTEAVSIRCK
jgi:hypothetical protein